MGTIDLNDLMVALAVLIAFFGALGTVGKGVEVLHNWRKPRVERDETTAKTLAEHSKQLDNDKRRLDAHEAQMAEQRRLSQVQCVAMKALLSHEINGNSVDKLKSADDQLDAFLIGVEK